MILKNQKTGLFAVFDSQKSKDRTAGPVFSSLGPVWLQSFCSLETGLTNTTPPPADIYKKPYVKFLSIVADWIKSHTTWKHNGLACEVIRGPAGNKIWGGVGVYTVLEIFFIAGNFLH